MTYQGLVQMGVSSLEFASVTSILILAKADYVPWASKTGYVRIIFCCPRERSSILMHSSPTKIRASGDFSLCCGSSCWSRDKLKPQETTLREKPYWEWCMGITVRVHKAEVVVKCYFIFLIFQAPFAALTLGSSISNLKCLNWGVIL